MRIFARIKDCIRGIRIEYIHHRLRYAPELRIHGRTVIVAPHPDDEVLGCGGLIARLVKGGQSPHVIVMTGGGASHTGCCDLSGVDLIEHRRKLTLKALTILGVSPTQIHFLNFPDGGVEENASDMQRLKSLLYDLTPAQVFVPHNGEGWMDHIRTAQIVKFLLPASVAVWEYCVWVWYYNIWRFDWTNARVLEMTADEHRLKLKAIDSYILPLAPCGNPWSGVLPHVFVWANKKKREFYFITK